MMMFNLLRWGSLAKSSWETAVCLLNQTSGDHLLIWPAIKGHVAVIRALLDGGVQIPSDDVVMALLRELKV